MKRIELFVIALLFFLYGIGFTSFSQSWPKVADVDLAKLKPSDFNDDELDIPYYLKHFHTVANSINESGTEKGYINIAVWRRPQDNKPYNARIMENILSLAYFYSTNRPWNPYYKSPAVKLRIEAALDFWINSQDSSGKFSEYGPQKWNLAGTSFATFCMGRTLELLTKAGGIDPQILKRTIEADKKAILVILTNKEFYEHGLNYTNQYTAGFAGALPYLKAYPDKKIEALLKKRINQTAADFQSPAGFFYEAGGTDHGYNLNTHHSNMRIMYDYTHGTDIGAGLIREEKKYVNWIALNAVLEPDGKFFTLNRGTETRTPAPVVAGYFPRSPLGESVELLRAFVPSKEDIEETNRQRRKLLTEKWPDVGKLDVYSPTILHHLNRYQWNPTKKQQLEARAMLPYLREKKFIEQRTDSRLPVSFTFVRQPGYYAAFNSGPVTGSRQRYGLGLLWHPAAGTFLQSQAASDNAAWGTKTNGSKVFEAETLVAEMSVDGKKVMSSAGSTRLPEGNLSVRYTLGGKGKKSLSFEENGIQVNVVYPGSFTEYLPLLLNENDKVDISEKGLVKLKKGDIDILIRYDPSGQATVEKTGMKSGSQGVETVQIKAQDKLSYTITTP